MFLRSGWRGWPPVSPQPAPDEGAKQADNEQSAPPLPESGSIEVHLGDDAMGHPAQKRCEQKDGGQGKQDEEAFEPEHRTLPEQEIEKEFARLGGGY